MFTGFVVKSIFDDFNKLDPDHWNFILKKFDCIVYGFMNFWMEATARAEAIGCAKKRL